MTGTPRLKPSAKSSCRPRPTDDGIGSAYRFDESAAFIAGLIWWMLSRLVAPPARPDRPPRALFAVASLGRIGYATVEPMPWSTVEEDDIATGERDKGIY
jgi:Na+/melibiose symporter-like transporter